VRINNSIKNITIGVISQLVIVGLGFISRKVFLDSLGAEYLGVNGLIDNILSMLGLIESGIGVSIIYFLYKPLAENDQPKIIALIQLFKKTYAIIAIIILALSIILFPFIDKLIKNSGSIPYITIVYFIFVGKNMAYFLNAHKVSLINADQKGFVLDKINLLFQILTTISKIIVLIKTNNYVLYLLMDFSIFIIQNIINGWIIDKRYAFVKKKQKYFLDKKEKKILINNVKALFLHNLGTFCVFGTDNILISAFIGISTVGLYSNYTMIIGQLATFLSPLLNGVGASVGNLIASESNEKSYSVFKVIYLLNFWIYSICVTFLFNILVPFIIWWLGKGYLLDPLTFILILVNFYLTGMRTSILIFKNKGGIFVQDKFMPLLEAIINLGTGLLLVHFIGLAGIFLGTTLSTLFTVFWNAPRLVYKSIFNRPVFEYFTKYFFYTTLTILTCLITTNFCKILVHGSGFMSLIYIGIICISVPNLLYVLIFYKTVEFQYVKNIFINIASGLLGRLTLKGN
jgi:O-antigen/teichoic acid export membrane protein